MPHRNLCAPSTELGHSLPSRTHGLPCSRLRRTLHILNRPVQYPAELTLHPFAVALARVAEQGACVASTEGGAAWARARERMARSLPLHLGVLGCSTTAGCGSLHPSAKCSSSQAWPRVAHDALAALPLAGLHTRVFHKNAVEASFYWDCTAAFLSPHADIVLLEVMQNAYGMSVHGIVNGTVRAVRKVAPQAAIVFVRWMKREQLRSLRASHAAIAASIAAVGADLVDLPSSINALPSAAVRALPSAPPLRQWHGFDSLYAGTDHHPSPQGHQILGLLAAGCIARRLRGTDPSGFKEAFPNRPPLETQGGVEEACYPVADQIPVARKGSGGGGPHDGFKLHDDGVAKGVQKLGYSSSRIGDRITLGPLGTPRPPVSWRLARS